MFQALVGTPGRGTERLRHGRSFAELTVARVPLEAQSKGSNIKGDAFP